MNENNKDNKNKILHGNSARIDPKKSVTPQFGSCVFNDYSENRDRYGRSYHRLVDDADFDREEVESIKL